MRRLNIGVRLLPVAAGILLALPLALHAAEADPAAQASAAAKSAAVPAVAVSAAVPGADATKTAPPAQADTAKMPPVAPPATESPRIPSAKDLEQIPMPFGPGYDPTRAAPEEPQTKGPEALAATLVVAGEADVEELREKKDRSPAQFFGVVLKVEVPADSVSPSLNPSSVQLKGEGDQTKPLLVACTPMQDGSLSVYQAPGGTLGGWHIAIDGRTWFCGGRTGRLAVRLSDRGVRLMTEAAAPWSGDLVLLFEAPPKRPIAVMIPGATVGLGSPEPSADPEQ